MTRHRDGTPADVEGSAAESALGSELAKVCEKLRELRAHAASLGLFTNDRELLTCPSCGLQEDVTIEGQLITHDSESRDVGDSGLRFSESQGGHFVCPRCDAHVVAGEAEALIERPPRQRP